MFGLSPHEWEMTLSMLSKLGVGALLGGSLGLERELRGHPAGVRTHILLILGVILFAEVSQGYKGADPSRVTAQIVTGVGFLCAGTILRTGTDVKGLTTSASLWATAGIGVAVSLGGPFMAVGVFATVLCLLTLTVLASLEKRFIRQAVSQTLKVTLRDAAVLADVIQQIQLEPQAEISAMRVEKKEPETEATLQVRGASQTLLDEILALEGVRIANLQ